MMQAIKQRVKIERDGVMEIHAAELLSGDEAEVIILLQDEIETEEEMAALVRAYDEAMEEIEASGEEPVPWEEVRVRLMADEQETDELAQAQKEAA